MQSVGELLIDFFRFYCHTFAFNNDVVSIRGGLLTKVRALRLSQPVLAVKC